MEATNTPQKLFSIHCAPFFSTSFSIHFIPSETKEKKWKSASVKLNDDKRRRITITTQMTFEVIIK